jgi:hypothetical protein
MCRNISRFRFTGCACVEHLTSDPCFQGEGGLERGKGSAACLVAGRVRRDFAVPSGCRRCCAALWAERREYQTLPSHLPTVSQAASSQQYSTAQQAQQGIVERVPSDLATGERNTPLGKRKKQDRKRHEMSTSSLDSSTLFSRAHPGPARHALIYSSISCQTETMIGYFSSGCVEQVFLAHLHAKVWCVPSTTTGSPWTSLCFFFWYSMVTPQRLDDCHVVVGVVDLTVSHLQQLTSSFSRAKPRSLRPRSILGLVGMTQASLLLVFLCAGGPWAPLLLWLAGVCESCA